MALKEVALKKWGIKETDFLYDIELSVARICTKMSRKKILFDSKAMGLDLVSQQLDIDSILNAINLITDTEVKNPMSKMQVANYLVSRGVPVSELKKIRGNTEVYDGTKQKLKELQKYESVSEFLKLVLKYRDIFNKNRTLESTYEAVAHRGYINPRFDSTKSLHGTIMSFGPSLNSSLYTKYFLPDEGTKLVTVCIEQQILYLLSNILGYEDLKKAYTESSIEKFTSSDRAKELLDTSLQTVYNEVYTTPYGRSLHEPYYWRIMLGSMADITKIALVRLTSNIENLTPKAVIGDDLIFQVPIDVNLDKLSDEINKVYQSVVPDGWIPLRLGVSELK